MRSAARSSTAMPPAVILGGSINTLWVTRSLARAGVAVTALADGVAGSYVRHSRHLDEFVDVPGAAAAQGVWMEWLRRHARRAVLIPCGDAGLELIARRRSELEDLGYMPIEANDGVLLDMLDKERTYALAESVGVETPRSVTVGSLAALRSVAGQFSYPCALKPAHSHRFGPRFGVKAVVAHDRAELEAALQRILPTGLKMILTEIIPGVDDSYCSYYTYIDEHGEPLVHFTKLKLRQRPIGFGMGTYHITEWVPDAVDAGVRFFRGIGLRGIGNVEFKRDIRDGRLKLIECNARLTQADELVRRAGVDFARLAYDRAAGRSASVAHGYRAGLRVWYPAEDFRAFLAYRREGQLTLARWLRSVAHRQNFPLLAFDDPKPSLAHAREFAVKGTSRATAALGRHLRPTERRHEGAAGGTTLSLASSAGIGQGEAPDEILELGA